MTMHDIFYTTVFTLISLGIVVFYSYASLRRGSGLGGKFSGGMVAPTLGDVIRRMFGLDSLLLAFILLYFAWG